MNRRKGRITLILGGARSGKSRRALSLAEPYGRRIFVATAEALDDEMEGRIAHHRSERDGSWDTVEAPIQLAAAIAHADSADAVILIDCLTLWLSNLLVGGLATEPEEERLVETIGELQADLLLVSNEVGFGLVPETPLGRTFRDAQGRLNQRIAGLADRVELVVAGLPLIVKDAP